MAIASLIARTDDVSVGMLSRPSRLESLSFCSRKRVARQLLGNQPRTSTMMWVEPAALNSETKGAVVCVLFGAA